MTTAATDPDPEYRYRFDNLQGLRPLIGDFCARRWDNNPKHWPHRPLFQALRGKPDGHGIYRICFWINEEIARKEWKMNQGGSDVSILLRVKVRTLRQVFDGWTFAEDDALVGKAEMIWTIEASCVANEGDEEFRKGGIPLEAIEVWTQEGGWQPWHLAPALLPEPVRMARIGWGRIAYRDAWNHVHGCYWHMLPDSRQGHSNEFWCLLTSDELLGGGVVNDMQGLLRVIEQVVTGPAAAYAGAVCGVLVVELVRQPLPEVWTRQYGVRWSLVEQNTLNHLPWGIRHLAEYLGASRRVHVPEVEACSVLELAEVRSLIERSGLRLAKEAPNEAWLSRLR